MLCSSLLDCMFSSLDLWSCLSTSGPSVSRLLRLIKVPLCLTHLVTPVLFPLLLFYYCFLSCVLLNSRTQMSSLFPPPPLSLLLRSRCLYCARLFYVISGVSSSVFIIPSSQFFIRFHSQGCEHTRVGPVFVCTSM